MGHTVLMIAVPFVRLSVEVSLTPRLEAKAVWDYRAESASIPARTAPAPEFRCSITSEPRCRIAMDSTFC